MSPRSRFDIESFRAGEAAADAREKDERVKRMARLSELSYKQDGQTEAAWAELEARATLVPNPTDHGAFVERRLHGLVTDDQHPPDLQPPCYNPETVTEHGIAITWAHGQGPGGWVDHWTAVRVDRHDRGASS